MANEIETGFVQGLYEDQGFPNWGYPLGGPYNQGSNMLRSILGSPFFMATTTDVLIQGLPKWMANARIHEST